MILDQFGTSPAGLVTLLANINPNTTCSSVDNPASGLVAGLCQTNFVSIVVPPIAVLSTYDEVWDLRFNSPGCSVANGCPQDDVTANVVEYEAYLAGGGNLYLMGANCNNPGRNNGIITFVNNVTSNSGFGNGGVQCQSGNGCCAQLGPNAALANNFPTNWYNLNSTTPPGAGGGQVWTQTAGFVNNAGTGIPIYVDDDTFDPAPTLAAPEAVAVAFPHSSLSAPYNAGKMIVSFDWHMLDVASSSCGGDPTADGNSASQTQDANAAYALNAYTFLANACTNTPTNTPTQTNTPAVTATATVTPAVTANYSVGINIYNSAGEVVKTFPAQGFSVPVDQVTLDSSVIATLSGPGSSVTIYFNGALLGIWDGTNQSGHAVSNGDYRIQISNVGNSGVVTTVSQKVVVNRKVSVVETDIFNSAGEAVRHLYNVADNATNENMTNVSLSTDIMKASALTIPNNSLPSQIKIQIQTSSTQINLIWDGSGDKGNYVTPGQYLIQVRWTDGNGNTTLIDHVVTVLPGIVVTGTVVAKPNFLSASNGLTTSFDASGVSGAAALKVNIYDIAGELVQKLLSPSPQVNWTASGVASGIYIAHVTVQNTNNVVIAQQSLKILVTH